MISSRSIELELDLVLNLEKRKLERGFSQLTIFRLILPNDLASSNGLADACILHVRCECTDP